MKLATVTFLVLFHVTTVAGQTAGFFNYSVDIGSPKVKGSTQYNANDQTYRISGGGYNIWFGRDEFRYTYKKLKGDFILTGNFRFEGEGKNPHRKLGWMVRADTSANAAHMTATVHGDGLVTMQWRRSKGAEMRDPEDQRFTKKTATQVIQLERLNGEFIMRVAHPGEPLQEVGRANADNLPDEVIAGIFVCSHDENQLEVAEAWNVRIERTVPDSHNGYRDGVLGSRLEVMDISAGKRKVVHEDKGRFEAPNWTRDNRLLFNQGGLIWSIPATGGNPELVNTGTAKRNNNDHVISMDGKWLGISSHRDGLPGGGSTIYYLPLKGGEPKLVTDSTPSYLHGWSTDAKEVVYTAQRAGAGPAYHIFRKGINGGKEVQLTHLKKGLADGPEYSSDGKWIYFNSTESGTMQIWRMKPDGGGKEQLTFDEYNNWFAHPSPDNKWIVFLSFPNTVDPTDHPFYKRVMLRLMPVSGGAPKVIAYLFGGQGTINTPSWSPDSSQVAFVSNSLPLNE